MVYACPLRWETFRGDDARGGRAPTCDEPEVAVQAPLPSYDGERAQEVEFRRRARPQTPGAPGMGHHDPGSSRALRAYLIVGKGVWVN